MSSDAPARRLHPLTLVFAGGAVARQLIFPALVGGISIGDGELDRAIPWVLALLAVPVLVTAAVRYASFSFHLSTDELVIRSGVLSRKHRVIPLTRVQNVEVRQGALQRLFGVAELRVETAGSSGGEPEAVLSVLARDEAQSLRAAVLAGRRASAPAPPPSAPSIEAIDGAEAGVAADPSIPVAEPVAAPVPLVRLTTGDVMLAGATANEAGVIIALALGALQLLDDLPVPWLERIHPFEWVERAGGEVAGPALVAVGVAALLMVMVLGWLISIVGAVVRYHGFTLAREGRDLRKRYGLLTVTETSVPLERVQAVRVEESLFRRRLGLASLMIETAGAAPGQVVESSQGTNHRGAEAFVPLARRSEVARLVRGVFGDFDLDGVAFRPVHPRSRRRAVVRWALILAVPALAIACAAWRAESPAWLAALAPLVPLPWWIARRQYQNRGWALSQGYVLARSGVLNRVTWIIPEHKLQTLHVHQTPLQRRHGLATLVVDTAAGGRQAHVPDLGAERAGALLAELTERVRDAVRAMARRRAAQAR